MGAVMEQWEWDVIMTLTLLAKIGLRRQRSTATLGRRGGRHVVRHRACGPDLLPRDPCPRPARRPSARSGMILSNNLHRKWYLHASAAAVKRPEMLVVSGGGGAGARSASSSSGGCWRWWWCRRLVDQYRRPTPKKRSPSRLQLCGTAGRSMAKVAAWRFEPRQPGDGSCGARRSWLQEHCGRGLAERWLGGGGGRYEA